MLQNTHIKHEHEIEHLLQMNCRCLEWVNRIDWWDQTAFWLQRFIMGMTIGMLSSGWKDWKNNQKEAKKTWTETQMLINLRRGKGYTRCSNLIIKHQSEDMHLKMICHEMLSEIHEHSFQLW